MNKEYNSIDDFSSAADMDAIVEIGFAFRDGIISAKDIDSCDTELCCAYYDNIQAIYKENKENSLELIWDYCKESFNLCFALSKNDVCSKELEMAKKFTEENYLTEIRQALIQQDIGFLYYLQRTKQDMADCEGLLSQQLTNKEV